MCKSKLCNSYYHLLQVNCVNHRALIMKWAGCRYKSLLIIAASFLILISGPVQRRVLLNLKSQSDHFPYITVHKNQTHNKPLCDNRTLTRIGDGLNFDYGSCPKNSIMLNSTRVNAKPLHDNCPQVFIIGARKGGTTSLYQYLSKHPDFKGILLNRISSAGETSYFSMRYETYPWHSYISKFPRNIMTGDASVSHLVHCKTPERLYTCCGRTTKVIILLRDPIERFQSNFRMRVRLGTATTQKASILVMKHINILHLLFQRRKVNMNDVTANIDKLLCLYQPAQNFVYEGMYYVHLHNWLCNFPSENFLILNSEEFFNKTKIIFSQVLDFVGLRPLDDGVLNEIVKVKYNYGGKVEDEPDHRLLSSSDKEKLQAIYKPFNEKLFDLLKWHNVNWIN